MQSIAEIISEEEHTAAGMLQSIAEGYESAFMDASSTPSDFQLAVDTFDGRVSSYEASRQNAEAHHQYQCQIVGRMTRVIHPETNIGFHKGGVAAFPERSIRIT